MADVAQRVTTVRHAPPLSWRDRMLSWRDGVLSNARFQQFAGSFALTRPIARRRASALFDLCAGFVYSQILQACVQLGLFEMLARGPLGADELAARSSMPPASMRLLLDAAVSLRLVQTRSGDRYGLGPLGAALLGNPGVIAMIRHHAMLYDDLKDPLALLRHESGAGQLARYWPYAGTDTPADLTGAEVSPYTALMAQSQPMISAQVLAAVSFAGHRCLLDVGGGNGAFLAAVAQKYPELRCMLFDLPAVAEQASQRFHREGLAARARAVGGSFLGDPLPGGADIISLVRILHDHNDDHVMTLLRAVHDALPAGGTLLIAEPLSGTRGGEAIADAYFAFYLLAMGSGRPRSFERLQALLTQAGFADIALQPSGMPMLTSVMTARKLSSVVDTSHVN
jgi:demethylspheroidene O-methyltransferase